MIGFGSPKVHESSSPYHPLDEHLSPIGEEVSLTCKRLDWKISDPFEIYSRIFPHFENSFILESSAGPKELAKYTFLGFDPRAILTLTDGVFYEDGEPQVKTSDPLGQLQTLERDFKDFTFKKEPPSTYLGGLVGYTSYDFVRYMEDLPAPEGKRRFPDLQMGLFLDGLVHDRDRGTLTYFSYDKDRSSRLRKLLETTPEEKDDFQIAELNSDFDKGEFTSTIEKAKDYIYTGDIYQTVLSRKLAGKFEGDQFGAYRKLRKINPSPYMYHLKFGDRRVIGSSPEKLVSVTDGEISTYPIAGTRPLGDTRRERERLRTDLLTDEKERAEHNMLVDLARNDVGRVAEYGTVKVPEYMEVKKFSHVQHIVSRVTGTLPENETALAAFGSLFPAGTVSGAPKIRAMELIEELEVSPRGPYAGAVGYLSFTGNLDTCITIRSLYTKKDRISLRAGAGIVADSDPVREWEEINHKLGALRDAVSSGGEGR